MMTQPPERAVFDCMVFAQALINPSGPAGACVELTRAYRIQLIISDYILAEVRELPGKLPARLQVTAERVERLLDEVLECAEKWDHVAEVYQHPWDQDDSPYVNLALAAGARLITTRDRHLLGLMDPAISEGQEFRLRFPALEIIRPEELLERIRTE